MTTDSLLARPASPTTVHHDPFTWAVVDGFFDHALTVRLAVEFPSDGFRVAGASSKLFDVRSLVVDGAMPSSARGLPASWQEAGRVIASAAYRERLGALVGRGLEGLRIDASLCRYPPGCSLVPHTDRDARDTTHVTYFNHRWESGWGGLLRILRSEDVEDVIEEVLPQLHTSVVMVRSECSWHAVTAVSDDVDEVRLSLLVHASHPDKL